MSYFSSGSFKGPLCTGASCPEAVASEARKARQINRLVAEAADDLIRWSVGCGVEALPPSPSLRQAKEALNRRSDPRCFICNLESPRRPISPSLGQQFCREIFREYLVTNVEMPILLDRHSLSPTRRRGRRCRAAAFVLGPGSSAFAQLRRDKPIPATEAPTAAAAEWDELSG